MRYLNKEDANFLNELRNSFNVIPKSVPTISSCFAVVDCEIYHATSKNAEIDSYSLTVVLYDELQTQKEYVTANEILYDLFEDDDILYDYFSNKVYTHNKFKKLNMKSLKDTQIIKNILTGYGFESTLNEVVKIYKTRIDKIFRTQPAAWDFIYDKANKCSSNAKVINLELEASETQQKIQEILENVVWKSSIS